MKKQMSRKEIMENARKMEQELHELIAKTEAAVIMSGENEKLVKLMATAEDIIRAKWDITEIARKWVEEKAAETDCEMVEVNDDWGAYYEEGGEWVRPEWFADEVIKNLNVISDFVQEKLRETRFGDDEMLESAEYDMKMLRKLHEEIAG